MALGGLVAFGILLAVLFLFLRSTGAFVARSTEPDKCPDADVRAFLASTEKAMATFKDQSKRAGSTARIALSPLVGEMQTLRRDYAAAPRPPCADIAAKAVTEGMDETIEALLAFMREDQPASDGHIQKATDRFRIADEQLSDLRVSAA